MKKILSICAVALLLASCSNDDDSQQEEFFNLKEGNLWVYKHYTVREDGSENFHGTDTVRVIGQETIEGESYFKLSHSRPRGDEFEYFRVNENGCLVNEAGNVIHPGANMEYQYTALQQDGEEIYGELHYSMETPKDVMVEGQEYEVYPYVAFFEPNRESLPAGLGNYKYYKQGLGLVVDGARYLTAKTYIEQRLVYYELQ